MEPPPERIVHADLRGLAGQHEEHRLERIRRGVVVAQHPAADAQDHRAVPLHQRRERRLGRGDILPAEEPRQQLGIRQPADGADVEQRLQVVGGSSPLPLSYLARPSRGQPFYPFYASKEPRALQISRKWLYHSNFRGISWDRARPVIL